MFEITLNSVLLNNKKQSFAQYVKSRFPPHLWERPLWIELCTTIEFFYCEFNSCNFCRVKSDIFKTNLVFGYSQMRTTQMLKSTIAWTSRIYV